MGALDFGHSSNRPMFSELAAVLGSTLATCGDCIKILDREGRVLFCNDAGLQMMEFADFSQLEGRRWTDFMSLEGAAAAEAAIVRAASGETARFLLEACSAKGNPRYWDIQMTPIRDRHGRPAQVLTIARNMTEQRLLEQQKEQLLEELRQTNETLERRVLERTAELTAANQRLTAKMAEHSRMDARLKEIQGELHHAARLSAAGQMAGAMAHELNQPLAAATSSAGAARRLLAGEDVDLSTAREVIDETAAQVKRAGKIIRRLREFVDRGETEKRFESVVTLIEEASALSLVGAEALGVTARFGFDPNAALAFVDRIQIQQVLVNL
ncbi:MAG: PAS domain-containing protein, partial [Gammaproteobacteria bacterium]